WVRSVLGALEPVVHDRGGLVYGGCGGVAQAGFDVGLHALGGGEVGGVGRQLDDVRPVAAGDRLAHVDAEESLLEVSVVWPGGAEGVVAGVIELRGCLGPHARLPRVDKTTGPVGVYSVAGCDGLAVAVAGPAAGEEAVVSL